MAGSDGAGARHRQRNRSRLPQDRLPRERRGGGSPCHLARRPARRPGRALHPGDRRAQGQHDGDGLERQRRLPQDAWRHPSRPEPDRRPHRHGRGREDRRRRLQHRRRGRERRARGGQGCRLRAQGAGEAGGTHRVRHRLTATGFQIPCLGWRRNTAARAAP